MAANLFSFESKISAPAADVFAYHERQTALQRLTPPWEPVRILKKSGGIENGDTVTIQMKVGPFKTIWLAEHQDYEKNRQFVDVQIKGPFRHWKHTHSFRSLSPYQTTLKDTVQFELPFGSIGHRLGYSRIRKQLNQLFAYRHAITENDLKHSMVLKSFPRWKVAITGGNGFIGSELAIFLQMQGHEVVILSRSGKSVVHGIPGARWDPANKFIDEKSLTDVDCWVHLAGENLSKGRWTRSRIKKLRDSRVNGTRFLVEYLLSLKNKPKAFICASGIGYYSQGQKTLTEIDEKGTGILSDICAAWEEASTPLGRSGIRRVILRTGIVLSNKGGALRKLLPIFKAGLGGVLGKGDQYWSWIAMDDLIRIYDTALRDPKMDGIYNAVAPIPVTNRAFTKQLGASLNRPTIFPAPRWILRPVLGRVADEALLASQNALPHRLKGREFNFNFPELDLALDYYLGAF